MAAGGQAVQLVNTGSIDNAVQSYVGSLAAALEACRQMKVWIDGPAGGLAGLQLFPAGGGRVTVYTLGDAQDIFNTFADLKKLSDVAHNLQTSTPLQDYFVNARKVGPILLP